ncbi:MAG: sugar transporter permease [Hyphomicrobiales bacterium]|nr:sugar transporter permease [Hyphomicrobiales bacterium]
MNTRTDAVMSGLETRTSAKATAFQKTMTDIRTGLLNYPLWNALAWQDIKQRYRRSTLGPLWMTISTAIMVGALGFVYSSIFGQVLSEYIPYVGIGLVIWSFISSMLSEACTVFVSAEGMIRQARLPFTIYVARVIWRNFIVLFHNAIIIVLVLAAFGKGFGLSIIGLPIALVLYFITSLALGVLLGIYCCRFRDIAQLIVNVVQVMFFITPIMWQASLLKSQRWVADYNPFHHYIEIVRDPLLGAAFPWESFGVVLLTTVLLSGLALDALTRFRHRIAYWV